MSFKAKVYRAKQTSKKDLLEQRKHAQKLEGQAINTLKLILYHLIPDETLVFTREQREIDLSDATLQVALDTVGTYTLRLVRRDKPDLNARRNPYVD